MRPVFEKIPEQLKSLPFWLTWHYAEKPGRDKPLKMPNVTAGPWDTKKLYSFPEVVKEFERCQLPTNNSRADGIGIAFTRNNNLIGIDIDDVSDDAIPADILAILKAGKTGYIERSVSRTGYHIIGTCSNKKKILELFARRGSAGGKSSDKKVEMYAAEHYFTVSGYCCYNNNGNIDQAVQLAFEKITANDKTPQTSVAALFEGTERSGENTPGQTSESTTTKSVAARTEEPWPTNAFTDEDIQKLRLRPVSWTIEKMYKAKPLLKRILEKDGYAAAPEYWQKYSRTTTKDKSPSGFDQEITSTLVFWLYRYGEGEVTRLLKKSKLCRPEKEKAGYYERTVTTAFKNAKLYFPATCSLTPDQQAKLNNWQAHKKKLAAD